MKKILSIVTLFGISALVHATTINAPASLVGANALNGNNAYSWGISISVPSGQTVTSAEIDFTGITLTAGNGTGVDNLYVDLLRSTMTGTGGVTTRTDNDASGDYWATQYSGANITSVGTQAFTYVGQTLTWSYILTASELTALNSYLSAGTFNIGIDPDCHYTVGGLCFTYNLGTNPNTVPDVAMTAFMVVIGLAGLEIFRRQFVTVKVNA